MAKKKEANEYMGMLILFVVFILVWEGVLVFQVGNLQREIASMPQYECKNETISNIVSINKIDDRCETIYYLNGDTDKRCPWDEFTKIDGQLLRSDQVHCDSEKEVCYYEITKEVCRVTDERFAVQEKAE